MRNSKSLLLCLALIIDSQTIVQASEQKSNSKMRVTATIVTSLLIGSVIINQTIIAPNNQLFSNVGILKVSQFGNTDDKYLRGSYSQLFDCDDDDCKHAIADKNFYGNDDNGMILSSPSITHRASKSYSRAELAELNKYGHKLRVTGGLYDENNNVIPTLEKIYKATTSRENEVQYKRLSASNCDKCD